MDAKRLVWLRVVTGMVIENTLLNNIVYSLGGPVPGVMYY